MADAITTSSSSISHHPRPFFHAKQLGAAVLMGGNENFPQIAEDCFPVLLKHLRVVTLHLDDSIRNVLPLCIKESHAEFLSFITGNIA